MEAVERLGLGHATSTCTGSTAGSTGNRDGNQRYASHPNGASS